MYTELKEILMPFNTKEVEHFNEATKDCSPEQKLAVAKRIAQEKLPDAWQFTESQIKRFVEEDSYSKINWFPTIKINNGSENVIESESRSVLDIELSNRTKTETNVAATTERMKFENCNGVVKPLNESARDYLSKKGKTTISARDFGNDVTLCVLAEIVTKSRSSRLAEELLKGI
jgi:hypothetical protein